MSQEKQTLQGLEFRQGQVTMICLESWSKLKFIPFEDYSNTFSIRQFLELHCKPKAQFMNLHKHFYQ